MVERRIMPAHTDIVDSSCVISLSCMWVQFLPLHDVVPAKKETLFQTHQLNSG